MSLFYLFLNVKWLRYRLKTIIEGGIALEKIGLNEFKNKIWYHYLLIEEDFLSTRNIVLIDQCNFSTVGIRYLNIIEACCGEIDSLLRLFCSYSNENVEDVQKASINKLRCAVQDELFILEDEQRYSLKDYELTNIYGIKLKPRNNYKVAKNKRRNNHISYDDSGTIPKWWSDYNKLKHKRLYKENFAKSNLENALYSLAGLYSVLRGFISYFELDDILLLVESKSKLFNEISIASDDEIKELLDIS